MKEKRNWENTEFTRQVRISEEDLQYLRKIKKKQTIATVLSDIIYKHKYGNARLRSEKGVETTNQHE